MLRAPTCLPVTHSARLYMLTFAANYPDQVAGMVLLDSTAPASAPGAPIQTGSYDFLGRIPALLPAAAHLGAARLYGQFPYNTVRCSRSEARASVATARHIKSFIDELRESPV